MTLHKCPHCNFATTNMRGLLGHATEHTGIVKRPACFGEYQEHTFCYRCVHYEDCRYEHIQLGGKNTIKEVQP
jgi:hypothetical protein